MSRYFNPASKILEVGRRLNGAFSLEMINKQLKPNEYLIGYYFNGSHHTAPWIKTNDLFQHFESNSIESTYFAINQDAFHQFMTP